MSAHRILAAYLWIIAGLGFGIITLIACFEFFGLAGIGPWMALTVITEVVVTLFRAGLQRPEKHPE